MSTLTTILLNDFNDKTTACKIARQTATRFPMSPRWSSYVVPKSPKGGLKTQNGRFPSKIAFCLKKVCYKVCLCKNCQLQSCKAFISVQKWLVGVTPSTWNLNLKYCLPVPVFYFWRKLKRTLQRGLSAIAEHLVLIQQPRSEMSRCHNNAN